MPKGMSEDVSGVIVKALANGLSRSQISGVVGVSKRAITRISTNLKKHGAPKAPPTGTKLGRPVKMTNAQARAMLTWIAERGYTFYVKDLVAYLRENHGYIGCDGTVRRCLVRSGFSRKLPWHKSEITSWQPPAVLPTFLSDDEDDAFGRPTAPAAVPAQVTEAGTIPPPPPPPPDLAHALHQQQQLQQRQGEAPILAQSSQPPARKKQKTTNNADGNATARPQNIAPLANVTNPAIDPSLEDALAPLYSAHAPVVQTSYNLTPGQQVHSYHQTPQQQPQQQLQPSLARSRKPSNKRTAAEAIDGVPESSLGDSTATDIGADADLVSSLQNEVLRQQELIAQLQRQLAEQQEQAPPSNTGGAVIFEGVTHERDEIEEAV